MDQLGTGQVCKVDTERRIVSGWAYVAKRANGEQVIDHSGDFLPDEQNLEDAAYDFVLHSREGDTLHAGPPTSYLVESFIVTKQKLAAMGLAEDALPTGWWVGFRVEDDATWARAKAGELAAFSIYGSGTREPMDA